MIGNFCGRLDLRHMARMQKPHCRHQTHRSAAFAQHGDGGTTLCDGAADLHKHVSIAQFGVYTKSRCNAARVNVIHDHVTLKTGASAQSKLEFDALFAQTGDEKSHAQGANVGFAHFLVG